MLPIKIEDVISERSQLVAYDAISEAWGPLSDDIMGEDSVLALAAENGAVIVTEDSEYFINLRVL